VAAGDEAAAAAASPRIDRLLLGSCSLIFWTAARRAASACSCCSCWRRFLLCQGVSAVTSATGKRLSFSSSAASCLTTVPPRATGPAAGGAGGGCRSAPPGPSKGPSPRGHWPSRRGRAALAPLLLLAMLHRALLLLLPGFAGC
jgi:hypothetical protein